MKTLALILYHFSLIVGAIYLIDQRGWSDWTMLLPFVFALEDEPEIHVNKKLDEANVLVKNGIIKTPAEYYEFIKGE